MYQEFCGANYIPNPSDKWLKERGSPVYVIIDTIPHIVSPTCSVKSGDCVVFAPKHALPAESIARVFIPAGLHSAEGPLPSLREFSYEFRVLSFSFCVILFFMLLSLSAGFPQVRFVVVKPFEELPQGV